MKAATIAQRSSPAELAPKASPESAARRAGIYFGGILFVWLAAWWAAFFPGVLTADSIDQWERVNTGNYGNGHPVLHTLTLALIRKIWDSPAAVALAQILFCAFVLGLSFYSLWKAKKTAWPLILYASLFFVFPIFGIYAVTLWKDVLFSAGLLLFMVVWLDPALFDRCIGRNWKRAAAAGAVIAYFISLRHNGSAFVAIIPAMAFARRRLQRPNRLALVSTTVGVYLLLQAALPWALNLESNQVVLSGQQFRIQIISAVAANNGVFTPQEQWLISAVSPMDDLARRYNCNITSAPSTYNPHYNASAFDDPDFVRQFNSATLDIALRNLPVIAADRVCLAFHMIGLGPPDLAYLYEVGVRRNGLRLSPHPVAAFRSWLLPYLTWSSEYPQRSLFWNYVPFFVLLWVGWRCARGAPVGRACLGLGAFALLTLLTMPARDHRYLFPVALITPFLFASSLQWRRRRQVRQRS